MSGINTELTPHPSKIETIERPLTASVRSEFRFDWLLLAATICLMIIGILSIVSARVGAETDVSWYRSYGFRQGIWYLLGSAMAAGICIVDYKIFCRFSLLAYWLAIAMLVLVMIPHIGSLRFGARRWFDLGLFQFQPSEFAKLAFIFAMAHFLERPKDELRMYNVFLKTLGMMALPFLLVLVEPDLGSSLAFVSTGLLMMFMAGVPLRYMKRVAGAGFLLVTLLFVDVVFAPDGWRLPLEDYQRRRLLVYFNQSYVSQDTPPEERKRLEQMQRTDSYNIDQALISVGSGGLKGKGWMQGTQTSLGFLPRPVAHNDFIFSVIAEEGGFLGSTLVVGLYGVIFFAGIRTASQARERLGRLLAVGVVALLFTHVMINIGMNIRLIPVTGIPLPLLSYGGSSVICTLLALGILQNVYLYRKNY